MLLASCAGFLDAYLYQHVTPVFVANHSGNLIRLGMDVGKGFWSEAAIALCAIVAFVIGVGTATIAHDRNRQRGHPARPALLLVAEVVLLLGVLALVLAQDLTPSLVPRLEDYPVIFVAAFAMGLQTAVLGRVGTVVVSTTYGSGSMAKIGEHTALSARSGAGRERRGHGRAVTVLLAVVATYAGGAALASVLSASRVALLIPIAVVAGSAYLATRSA